MKKKIVTFGEIMLRISPFDVGERIEQAGLFRVEPGGSESNVAIGLARLGHSVSFLTKIPDNLLKNLISRYLKGYNIDSSHVAVGGKRLGIYWTENGTGPRATNVIYDREGSSFFDLSINDFDWSKINKDIFWFHISGITPAISEKLSQNIFSIVNSLDKDIKISIDLNYRHKLWQWVHGNRKKKVKEIMNKLCSKTYLITGNESDFHNIFGCSIADPCNIESYKNIARMLFDNIASLNYIAVSLRTSYSASENDWSGILFVKEGKRITHYVGQKYKLNSIVDRVGTGDSFTAGIIHGILCFKSDYQHMIDFATALSALNHTTFGDASQFDQKDVEAVLGAKGSGRIIR